MIPHIQFNGQSNFMAMSDRGVVQGFLAVRPDGGVYFHGGTPWAPTDAPDAIDVAGAQLAVRYAEQHKKGSEH